jgi:hypothetical protein
LVQYIFLYASFSLFEAYSGDIRISWFSFPTHGTTVDPKPPKAVPTSISEEFRMTTSDDKGDGDDSAPESVTQVFAHHRLDDDTTEYFCKLHGRSYRDYRWVLEAQVASACAARLSSYKKKHSDASH